MDNRKPATLAAVLAFLLGEAPLDGLNFTEPHDGRPRYWWRYHLREAMRASIDNAGVPLVAARTLLRQAELFEQLFGLHDVLDVAYVADTLRAAAGAPPMHDGATSARSALLEARRVRALDLLERVEHLATAGHVARVQLVDGEPIVSSDTVHASLAQAIEDRDNLAAELLEERNRVAQ